MPLPPSSLPLSRFSAALPARPQPAGDAFKALRRARFAALFLPAALAGCALMEAGPLPKAASPAKTDAPSAPARRRQENQSPAAPAEPPERHAPVEALATVPVRLMPLAEAPTLTLDQLIQVRFLKKALDEGAPASVPPLRAMVLIDETRIAAVITAMGLTVWRFVYSAAGIAESRAPQLDGRIDAEHFLRDLMFVLWPLESVKRAYPEGCVLENERGASRTRTLEIAGRLMLRAVVTKENGRFVATITNDAEGYALSIASASQR